MNTDINYILQLYVFTKAVVTKKAEKAVPKYVKLENLHHFYKAYLQIQKWLFNDLPVDNKIELKGGYIHLLTWPNHQLQNHYYR